MAKRTIGPMGIYVIRNTSSGRVYVGSAIDITKRWLKHLSDLHLGKHHSVPLQRSWDKHGEAAFRWDILELVSEKSELLNREQHWIDQLGAARRESGLNQLPVAGSRLGIRHTPEAIAKIVARFKGVSKTEAHRLAMSAARTGEKASGETRAKLSAMRLGVPKNPEHREAIGLAQRGKTIPEEQRLMISDALSRYFENNPSAKDHISTLGREWGSINGKKSAGRVMSVEERAMRAEAQNRSGKAAEKGRIALASLTPDQRARALAGRKGRPNQKNRSMTYDQAQEARRLKAEGWTYDRLVEKFGLDRASMFRLIKGQTYTAP